MEGIDNIREWWQYTWLRRKLRDVYYSIRNRFFAKYYLVDIKAMPRDAWWDTDHKMFHAVFQLLTDFIVKELGHGSEKKGLEYLEWEMTLDDEVEVEVDYSKGHTQASAAKKAKELYLWYKYEYPKRPDPYADETRSGKDVLQMENDQYKEENEKVYQLFTIRDSLWT